MNPIRRCLVMGNPYGDRRNDPLNANTWGPNGPNGPHDLASNIKWGPGGVNDSRRKTNLERARETKASYVRLWADWSRIQPRSGPLDPDNDVTPDEHGNTPRDLIRMLDAQVATARQVPMRVMLTVWNKPLWVPPENTDTWTVPADLTTGPAGHWAGFISFLLDRYSTAKRPDGYIDFLEICNEPNFQMKPQRDSQNNPSIHCHVAQMFQTAQALRRPGQPKLAGPATSDWDDPGINADHTHFDEFTTKLLEQLRGIDFREDGNFVWTHHNYRDTRVHNNTNGRAETVLSRLQAKGWRGWTDTRVACNQQLMITEGGYHISRTGSENTQRTRVYDNFTLMRFATGIAMHSNYLLYSDADFGTNTGLLDPIAEVGYGLGLAPPGSVGDPRPLHTDTSRGWSHQPAMTYGEGE